MAGALIGALRVSLSAETSAFVAGMKRAQRQAATTAKSIQGSFGRLKSTLSSSVAGFVGALTIGALVAAGKSALDYAGHLGELAATLGVTTKDLQTFSYAAGQVGVSQDALENSLQKLTITLGQMKAGAEAPRKALDALHKGLADQVAAAPNTGAAFRLIADAMSNVTDRTQRAAVEVALFKKSGAGIDNLLSGAQGSLNDLSDAAERLGIVLSDEQIRKADQTADKIAALQTVLKARIAGAVADNANSILSLADAIAKLTGEVAHFLGSNPQLALGIIGGLAGSRVGGLPGAALGAVGGVALGGKMARNFADNNSDLAFRTQQMRAAQREYLAREAASKNPTSIISFRHGSGGGGTVADAKKEFIRQIGLLQGATAASKQPPPLRSGANVGQFLAGGGEKKHKEKDDHTAEKLAQQAYDLQKQDLQAQEDILQAKRDLSQDYVEQTTLSVQILDNQREQYKAELDYKVKQYELSKGQEGITAAQEQHLLAEYDIADGLKRQKLLQDEQEQRQRDVAMLEEHDFDRKKEMLGKLADLATTQSERRQIELDLLKLAYEEKRQALQRIIDNSKDAAAIEDARRDLLTLNANFVADKQGVINNTAGPLEEWRKSVPKTAAEINEALQSIEVQGLDGLTDALTGVITGTESLRDAFHQLAASILADLIKMTIKMLLFRAISSIAGGGGFDSAGMSATIAGNSAAMGVSMPGGFATGGFVSGGGSSTSDSIPAMLSNGEFVVNAKATRRFLPFLEQLNDGATKLAVGGIVLPRAVTPGRDRVANDVGPSMPSVALTFHNDFRGVDASSVAQVQAQLDRLKAELPGQIVSTWSDANDRFAFRGKFK